jgi:hypothetical protein
LLIAAYYIIWDLFPFLVIGMTDFIDSFSDLPNIIDVGGERYYMGPGRAIELEFKSYQDYRRAFGNAPRTEYLLRKYMYRSLTDKKRLVFESPEEKSELIKILKGRANQLKESERFTSSLLKNTNIQRTYINIQQLIQELEGPDYKGFEFPSLPDMSLPCTKAKRYIKQIPEERLFQLILEIAWYLLHPDMVDPKVQCSWATAIKQLDTLRAGDLLWPQIQAAEVATNKPKTMEPMNFFKKVNLANVAKADSLKTAFDEVLAIAKEVEGENANAAMKDLVTTLLKVLQVKKYLDSDIRVNGDRLGVIDVPAVASKLQRTMIKNPMAGGGKAIDEPLQIAMKPLFDYFKVVFDPVYTLVANGVKSNSPGNNSLKRAIIPQLTTILHICNSLNPVENPISGGVTYGVYKITNVDKEIIDFFTGMLNATAGYLSGLQMDQDKNNFTKQVFYLPRVRISSLLGRSDSGYKDPDTIPYIQFFTVGGNITLKDQQNTPELGEATKQFFTPADLYISCTSSKNKTPLEIPMNTYEIDYDTVDVSGQIGLDIKTPDNYFNKNKESKILMEDIVNLTPYAVFNDAELALSIFAAFKELMPNQNERSA